MAGTQLAATFSYYLLFWVGEYYNTRIVTAVHTLWLAPCMQSLTHSSCLLGAYRQDAYVESL